MSQCSLCGGEILDRSDSRYCVYCDSTFHRGCIVDHFYRNKYCPVCNKKMSLIFMRYGEPPEPAIKKRPIPPDIRKPKWPHMERRREVPVFDIEIPTGPLKRTDKYIPRARGKREMPRMPKKVPGKLVGVVVILVVATVGAYYGLSTGAFSLELPGKEASPESPWKVVWTYAVEGVSDIAASEYGIVVGGRNGFAVLDFEGSVLWDIEGEITDVDIEDVVVVSNRGVIEVYTIDGSELAQYGEGTADSVSLSEFGILAVGLSDGGMVLLDIYGTVLQEYPAGEVGAVSISPDSTVTAYREGETVYVLDVLGEVEYAFEDEGSADNQIIVLSSGWVFAHGGGGVFLYDGDNVVWSAQTEGCEQADLSVSVDETKFAVNADTAAVYSADGESLFTLPKGGCGGIAFSGEDIVVSDSGNVYYLRLEEEEPEEVEEAEPEEEPEETEEPEEGLESYEDWFTWYASFLSVPGNSAEYSATVEEEGEISLQMQVYHTIEGREGDNLIEIVSMTIRVGEYESKTSFKRWVNAQGACTKAEMTIDESVSPLDCNKTNIRGIDLREILSYQWEYLGQEDITVEKGTFTCHKLQVSTDGGVLTMWITSGKPPIRITLQEGTTIVTIESV